MVTVIDSHDFVTDSRRFHKVRQTENTPSAICAVPTKLKMVNVISYDTVSRVMESWELARQKHSTEEQIGTEILFHAFRISPEHKTLFGFHPHQDVENNPLLRMGVLVHGTLVVRVIDGVLSLLGPDEEMMQGILGQLCQEFGVKEETFVLLGDAISKTITSSIGERHAKANEAWSELFTVLATK